ncbi:dynactin [Cyathus striatus]|nr:dynactin [Cyathus striatus]
MDPALGTIVTVPQGRGVIRFAGSTSFSTGRWIGIELAEANGKNDGSVKGVSYFNCKMGHGVFVRQSQIKSMHGSELEVGSMKPPPPPGATPARPSPLGHQRTPSLRSSTLKATPSPRSTSPAKPTVAALSVSTSRRPGVAPGPPSPTKRTASFTAQQRGKSLALRPGETPAPSTPSPPSRQKIQLESQEQVRRTSSPLSVSALGPARRASSPPIQPPPPLVQEELPPEPVLPAPVPVHPSAPPFVSDAVQKPASPVSPTISTTQRDDTELHIKLRYLETKRADDARKIRELEARITEADTFIALRPKLQAKLNSQQQEIIALKRELADAEQLSSLNEGRVVDGQEQLEMAMLDKEVAEERAELAEAEVEELKERVAVLEVEMGVMKEGGGPDAPARDSLAYIQLERHNERLKEALIKLRDMSQETEQELRHRIQDMEKDVSGIDELQAQYEESLIKLSNAETEIEGLKLQVDDSLGVEDMLVQLTERNLMLGEKIEEMRITIEDLEALKELNDELEENHLETEKQMQEDLDAKDVEIREHTRKIESLEEACQDYENTIMQFRELVMQLQSDLDNLRTQTQTAQHESASAVSQTAAIMSLNLKLQSSFSKAQSRQIELELYRLEAREARELLNIVQPYLPQVYVESDWDATSSYLFFQRLGAKTELISTVAGGAHGLPEALNGEVGEDLVGVCEMQGRISGLATLCKRFAAVLRRCDSETFLNIGRLYPEMAPLEKRVDMHLDLLKRDEFRVMECVGDIVKIQAQFDHLAESYFDGFDHDLAERELGYLHSFDHDLDMFLASIGLAKTSVTTIMQDKDAVLDMGGYDVTTEVVTPLQKLLDQCKSAKVLSKKLTKRVEDLAHDSAAVKAQFISQMKGLSDFVAELINFGISLAQQINMHVRDARSSKSPFLLTSVLSMVKEAATATVAKGLKPGSSPWEAVGASIAQLVEEGGKLLPMIMENESVVKVTGTEPWIARIPEIKTLLSVNIEAERKMTQLNEEIQGLVRNLKLKDQTMQESGVKIELMERRMEAVKKQADTIVELENELGKARRHETEYEEAMEQLQTELDALQQDNNRLRAAGATTERQAPGVQQVETENVAIEGSLETSHLLEQIDALRGTVRYLRTENSYLKGQDLLREIDSLPPLSKPSRTPTPPLDPSGLSDTDTSSSDEEDEPAAPTSGMEPRRSKPVRIRPPPSLNSLAAETKMLYKDVFKFSTSPRVVDLSILQQKREQVTGGTGKVWLPRKKTPAHQVLERKLEAEKLSRRVHGLLEKASAISGRL